jgi:putative hemolysin
MSRGVKILVGILGGLLLLGLVALLVSILLFWPVRSSGPALGAEVGLSSPASVYCKQQAGRLEMDTAAFCNQDQETRRTS